MPSFPVKMPPTFICPVEGCGSRYREPSILKEHLAKVHGHSKTLTEIFESLLEQQREDLISSTKATGRIEPEKAPQGQLLADPNRNYTAKEAGCLLSCSESKIRRDARAVQDLPSEARPKNTLPLRRAAHTTRISGRCILSIQMLWGWTDTAP